MLLRRMLTMTDDKLEGEGRNVINHSAGIFLEMLTKNNNDT